MSDLGFLSFYLGIEVHQGDSGITLRQTASIGYVSRFIQRPTTEHQQAVKRIIRYVTGTLDHGLYYPRCPREAHLVRYNDSDHVGDIDTSKSTSGILFFFDKCLISWQSVKQEVVALSNCEAEYIAAV
jgi:hypothetical protein